MKPKVYPAKDKADEFGTVPLYIYCNFNGQQDKFYTGERAIVGQPGKVKPGEWDQDAQCFAGNSKLIKLKNANIQERVELLERTYRSADLTGIPVTKAYLRSEYEVRYPNKRRKQEPVQSLTFFDLWDLFRETYKGQLSDSHLIKFRTVSQHLKRYNPRLTFSDITENFYEDYMGYLINELQMATATLEIHTSCIRRIMTFARKKKIIVADDFETFHFEPFDTDRSWLTWEELMKLYEYKTPYPGKRKAIDAFLFACFTGLRYSDARGLKPENIVQGEIWLTQEKGKNFNRIPLNQYAATILDKYKGGAYCLPMISNHHTNRHVKEACRRIGLTQLVEVVTYSGNNRRTETCQKWELITFHVARHTFATISLQRGMKLEILQRILGHRDINTTLIYAKIVDEAKHEAMKDVWG